MTIDLDALEKLADEATCRTDGGEWKSDDYGIRQIWAKSLKGGNAHIADVRGWGYFTGMGHGALGLTEDEGIEAQRQIGQFIAAANPANIKALIAELKEARGLLANIHERATEGHKQAGCDNWRAVERCRQVANLTERAFLARNVKGEG